MHVNDGVPSFPPPFLFQWAAKSAPCPTRAWSARARTSTTSSSGSARGACSKKWREEERKTTQPESNELNWSKQANKQRYHSSLQTPEASKDLSNLSSVWASRQENLTEVGWRIAWRTFIALMSKHRLTRTNTSREKRRKQVVFSSLFRPEI